MLNPNDLVGQIIDRRYRLVRSIGSSSFAWVYAADEMAMGRAVRGCALKLYRQSESHYEEALALREIDAMARLTHPSLVTMYGTGTVDEGLAAGCTYLATEPGQMSLADRLRQPQRMTRLEVHAVARDLAEALTYLAREGAVHRDVKPENLIRVNGTWKLGDFGLTAAVGSDWNNSGTLLFMPPEAVRGDVPIDPATDVWAMGVTLQSCITGRFPYPMDGGEGDYIARLLKDEPHVVPGLPVPFDAVVRGCLRRDPAARWTARRVLEVLQVAAKRRRGSWQSPTWAGAIPSSYDLHPTGDIHTGT